MTLPWRLMRWTGSAWANAELRKWNGTAWATVNMYRWDGSAWALLTDRTPPTQTYTEQYGTLWSRTFEGDDSQRDDGTANRYQGQSAADSWGIQKCMWGLSSTVHSDIDGAVDYYSSRVFLRNSHWWYNAGGTASLGTHTRQTSAPSTFSSNRNGQSNPHFDYGENRWVTLNTNWCSWADAGTFYGHTLYKNSTSLDYYGYFEQSITHEQSFEK